MQDNNSESYEKIIEYEQRIHEKNQNRIKIGIRILLIIPLLFLAIMFKLESSKVVFLVLWIVSLFCIAFYLIGVEYMDYQLQIKLSELGLREEKPIQGLINEDSRVERIIVNAGLLDDDRPSRFKALVQKDTPIPDREKEEEIIVEPVVSTKEAATAPQQTDTLSDAEEELVQSIRKYITALGNQSVQNGTALDAEQARRVIEEIPKRSPQDFAAMRKARALEKHEKE